MGELVYDPAPEPQRRSAGDADVAANGNAGREAFGRYGEVAGPFIQGLGGRIVFSVPAEQVLIGPDTANWHVAAIMFFPSRQAFLQMTSDASFQRASRHRKAALKNHQMVHLNGETFKP